MTREEKIHKQLMLLDTSTYEFCVTVSAFYPLWKTFFRRNLESGTMKTFRQSIKEAQKHLPHLQGMNANVFQLAKGIREGYVWLEDQSDVV